MLLLEMVTFENILGVKHSLWDLSTRLDTLSSYEAPQVMACLLEKGKLLKGLLTGERAYVGPFYATVDVTQRCNLRCPGCPYHSIEAHLPSPGEKEILDIPFDLFKRSCHELKTMGTRNLIITAEGEPLLHPLIFEMISTAREMGFRVTLFTNGTFLDEMRVQALIDSRLDLLRVSLWGSTLEEYVNTYPGTDPANFNKVIEGIKLMVSNKAARRSRFPLIELYQPFTRYNFERIEDRISLALTTGCRDLSFSPFVSLQGKSAHLVLTPNEERQLSLTLFGLGKKLKSFSISHNIDETLLYYRIGKTIWQKQPCYIGWLHARITADGTVLPCVRCNLSMGHLEEKGFHEIWNGVEYRNFRRQALLREGLVSVGKECDCIFCCHVRDNVRVHRFFKWFLPFLPYPNEKRS
jgi:MoaA/NifB/PqqE/SkfB family radical SAM enzyme